MSGNRGIETDEGWVNRKFRELERMIEEMRHERRTAATTIGNGGSLEVDGGDVIMRDTDGSIMFRLGTQTHGDRGLTISRAAGEEALSIARLFSNSTQQEVRLKDRYGFELVAEEALGSGPAKPFLHIPMVPVLAAAGSLNAGPYSWEVPVTSGTYVDVFRAGFARHNQFGSFRLRIAASDTTTSGEVRLVNANTSDHLGQFLSGPYTATRATGSTAYTEVLVPSIFMPGDPWVSIALALQVRRTAGAGTLRVAVAESRGGIMSA